MSAPTEPTKQPIADVGRTPGTPTLERDAIGLGRSTIFAMAGAARARQSRSLLPFLLPRAPTALSCR